MNVLVACEYSGRVREAFRKRGHNAWSCDLLPADDKSIYHYQQDVLEIIESDSWDMMIAFPPCTYLCSSGLHWNKKRPERALETEKSLEFVEKLLNSPIDKILLENPIGCISTRIRKPDQIIQPWMFGHPESKSTCLWLKNLPLLKPTCILEKTGKYWDNQTPSGQNKLPPSADRWKIRSTTYQGIADAIAEQYG